MRVKKSADGKGDVPLLHRTMGEGSGLLRSRHTKREPNGSLFAWQTASGMRSHVTEGFYVETDVPYVFQYRKRYEVTCDSVSGRPQKQKAQIMVLENLLETEHAIALFQLSLHTPRVCNDPVKPYIARLAAIRGKSENLPRFFASGRFSGFYCTMLFHICQTSPRRKIAGRR